MRKKQILSLVTVAISSAIYYLLARFTIEIGLIRIALSGLPVVIVAILLGPVEGMMVGLLGGFLGQLTGKYGLTPTTPLWIMPPALRGLIVGLFARKWDLEKNKILLFVSMIISSIIVTTSNTFVMYIDSIIYHYYTYAIVFGDLILRFITGVITAIVFSALTLPILIATKKIIRKN